MLIQYYVYCITLLWAVVVIGFAVCNPFYIWHAATLLSQIYSIDIRKSQICIPKPIFTYHSTS